MFGPTVNAVLDGSVQGVVVHARKYVFAFSPLVEIKRGEFDSVIPLVPPSKGETSPIPLKVREFSSLEGGKSLTTLTSIRLRQRR
jgi:hypothetical protein